MITIVNSKIKLSKFIYKYPKQIIYKNKNNF